MSERAPTVIVDILGGDPVIVRVLDALLRGAGFQTRLLTELPQESLPGSLLLFIPGGSLEVEDSLLEKVGVPVLRLATRESEDGDFSMLWPCRIETLKAKIESAISGEPEKAV